MSSDVQSEGEWITVGDSKNNPSSLHPDEVAKKIEERRLRRARYKEAKKLRKEEEKRLAMFAPKDSKVRVVKILPSTQVKKSETLPSWSLENDAFPALNSNDKDQASSGISYANAIKKKPEIRPPPPVDTKPETSLFIKKKLGQPILLEMKPVVKMKQSSLKKLKVTSSKIVKNNLTSRTRNILDSSAPIHLGKNQKARRKKKRPGRLKRIILKEKSLRRAARELSLKSRSNTEGASDELLVDSNTTTGSNELHPVTEQPPYIDSAKTALKETSKASIHNRKFRNYCDHMLDKSLDEYVASMTKDIIRWQDRAHSENPIRARANRRYVLGIRETKKHVAISGVKLVIIASDLEPIKSDGGLDDAVEELKSIAKEKSIPVIFSHTRWKLGYITYRKNPVACIGVMNYQGSDENYHKIMELLPSLREEYMKKAGISSSIKEKCIDEETKQLSLVDTIENSIKNKMIEILKL